MRRSRRVIFNSWINLQIFSSDPAAELFKAKALQTVGHGHDFRSLGARGSHHLSPNFRNVSAFLCRVRNVFIYRLSMPNGALINTVAKALVKVS